MSAPRNHKKGTSREQRGCPHFAHLYRRYERRALQKDRDFELTEAQFRKITKMDCHYCGRPPEQSYNRYSARKSHLSTYGHPYIYNGVDRVDSTLGYVLENCVPCCGTCNIMKSSMSVEEFYGHIKKITEFAKNNHHPGPEVEGED